MYNYRYLYVFTYLKISCVYADHTKLCGSMPDVQIDEIHVAMEKVFINMRKNLEKEGIWPDNLPKR